MRIKKRHLLARLGLLLSAIPDPEGGTPPTPPPPAGDDQADPPGADALGDPGKRALDTMKAERNAARAALKTWEALGVGADEVAQLLSTREGEAERIKQRELEQAALTKANQRLIAAEVKAAAKGVLADPADAHKFLDLAAIDVDEQGQVDSAAIETAIAELVKSKPYLGVQDPRFGGGADGGPRKADQKSLDQRIAEARAAGNHGVAIALELSKLTTPVS